MEFGKIIRSRFATIVLVAFTLTGFGILQAVPYI